MKWFLFLLLTGCSTCDPFFNNNPNLYKPVTALMFEQQGVAACAKFSLPFDEPEYHPFGKRRG